MSGLQLSRKLSNSSRLLSRDWQLTLRGLIFCFLNAGGCLVGDELAKGRPGEDAESILVFSLELLVSLENLLLVEMVCKSKRVVLKFGRAHSKHSHAQLLESIHSYIVDLIF